MHVKTETLSNIQKFAWEWECIHHTLHQNVSCKRNGDTSNSVHIVTKLDHTAYDAINSIY